MCGIYKITNLITGKSYIGLSTDIKRRWCEHRNRAHDINAAGYKTVIAAAFRKYGIENFSFEVIEECDISVINEREIYYINKYNTLSPNGYNVQLGGDNHTFNGPLVCKQCGKPISRGTVHKLCSDCYRLTTRKVNRPSKDELYLLLKTNPNFSQIGKQFGVTDNTIRKWCKSYNLPYHTSDYKKLSQ